MPAVALMLAFQVIALQSATPDGVHHVDLIVVNQCHREKFPVTWYTSFWDIHYFPPWGICRIPAMRHRGWQRTVPLARCTDGWCHSRGAITVVAPRAVLIVSGYDFEARNRHWSQPLRK